MPKFLLDEGCDAIVGRTLRSLGFDVTFVAEVAPGKSDEAILIWGIDEERIIITEDRDFSELIFRDNKPSFGLVFMRIGDDQRQRRVDQIQELVNRHQDDLAGAIATVSPNKIKIRSLR